MCGPWECRRGQDCACPLWGHPIVQDHSPGGMPNLSHHSWTQTQTPAALKAKGLWRWHRVFWANISWKSIHFFLCMYLLFPIYLFIYLERARRRILTRASSCHCGAWLGTWSQVPCDHDPSQIGLGNLPIEPPWCLSSLLNLHFTEYMSPVGNLSELYTLLPNRLA